MCTGAVAGAVAGTGAGVGAGASTGSGAGAGERTAAAYECVGAGATRPPEAVKRNSP